MASSGFHREEYVRGTLLRESRNIPSFDNAARQRTRIPSLCFAIKIIKNCSSLKLGNESNESNLSRNGLASTLSDEMANASAISSCTLNEK